MAEQDIPPIERDEILYRRIPDSQKWYSEDTRILHAQAFHPNKQDVTGISLNREKYTTIAAMLKGKPGKKYYVAKLKAADLFDAGINVVADKPPGEIGHAEIPDMNCATRQDNATAAREVLLAGKLTIEVLGPFYGTE